MIGAMNGEDAAELNVGGAGGIDLALYLGGAKDDFGIFRGLENFPVHAGVARVIAAFAAGCRHNNLASSFPGLRIEMNSSALHGKGAVYGVHRAAHTPMHG